MSCKAGDPRGRAGFTLLEALVALAIAGLVIPVVGRAMAQAWSTAQVPADVLSAVALARSAAAGAPAEAFEDARARGFAVERSSGEVSVVELKSALAPAPPGGSEVAAPRLDRSATPASIKLAEPPAALTAAPNLSLRRVTVVVRQPSGRRFVLDTVRLDDGPR